MARYLRGEAIAAARYILNVQIAVLAIAQNFPKRPNMNPERGLLDKDVRPDAGDQLVLANDLARTLNKGEQKSQARDCQCGLACLLA